MTLQLNVEHSHHCIFVLRVLHFKWKWQSLWWILITLLLVVTPHGDECSEEEEGEHMRCTRRWNDFEVDGPRCRNTAVSEASSHFCVTFCWILVRATSSGAPPVTGITRTQPRRTAPPTRWGTRQTYRVLTLTYIQLGTAVGGDYGLWQSPKDWSLIPIVQYLVQ